MKNKDLTAIDVLRMYEQWEANCLNHDSEWDRYFPEDLWEQWVEIQQCRNEVLSQNQTYKLSGLYFYEE